MTDDLVVREWDTAMMPFLEVTVAIAEHNALRRAHLALVASYDELLDAAISKEAELLRKLAAMTAERDAWQKAQGQSDRFADQWCEKAKAAEAQLAASEAECRRMHDKVRADCDHKLDKLSQALEASEAARGRLKAAVDRFLDDLDEDELWGKVEVLKAALAEAEEEEP